MKELFIFFIGVTLGVFLGVNYDMLFDKNIDLDNQEIVRLKDSLDAVQFEIDSLNGLIVKKEDSVLTEKQEKLIKIEKVYVEKIRNIDSLPLDDQVKLLSKNLSNGFSN